MVVNINPLRFVPDNEGSLFVLEISNKDEHGVVDLSLAHLEQLDGTIFVGVLQEDRSRLINHEVC